MVGTFTFLGLVLGGTAVANTIGNFVMLDDLPTMLSLTVVLCGLFAATAWNLITWWRGLCCLPHPMRWSVASAEW
ncbi:inorganic phosphate transporter [Marinobacterium iners]|uniref:Phosphate transporter family protein n=1 Tax=Marinobacterium iners DSM 11526 TaxID=1122198 RepID=A0A1H4H4F6_9GAMM|nr:inorganic phosphate transporter [Marinobacterium iners]SEB16511.1 Phosphate transporter family protein [Marinobacterium iners DSM 11526]